MTKFIKLTEYVVNSQLTESTAYVAVQHIVSLGQGTIQASKSVPSKHATKVTLMNNQVMYVEEPIETILKDINK